MPERRAAPDHPRVSAAELARDPSRKHELLGRVPQPADPRDHLMRDKLADSRSGIALSNDDLNKTLQQLLDEGFWKNWRDILAFWKWIKASRKPPPTPDPKQRRSRLWEDVHQLDQGSTGHCEGFAWSQWGNTLPVDDAFTNADGHAVYYECKVIDGEPKAENGSYTRSGAKAMQDRGRLGEYVFAKTPAEIVAWVLDHGPVVVGTDWDNPMFDLDSRGYLLPNGDVAGGHAWAIIGYDDGQPNDYVDAEPYFVMQNSWGLGWGVTITEGVGRLYTVHTPGGRAKITLRAFESLWSRDGDGAAGAELPQ